MYYYVNGTVAEIGPNLAVIDCGGVGYACATTNYTLAQLKKGRRPSSTPLYVRERRHLTCTALPPRQGAEQLQDALSVFLVWGPRPALAILSSGHRIRSGLSHRHGDEKALTGVPGIGKKIAQRIILELKDKMAKEPGEERNPGWRGSPVSPEQERQASGPGGAGIQPGGISAALKGVDTENRCLWRRSSASA